MIFETFYFIYSSWQNHELCYATSAYPDRDFVFRGTIVSNGDVGFQGRTNDNKVAMTGTTHGSIEKINDQWYVFYHRLTHKSDYSRQACAEKISIDENGSAIGEIAIGDSSEWTEYQTNISVLNGVHALFFVYHGSEKIQLKEIFF